MSWKEYDTENQVDECKPMLDACTPLIYRQNAFRITGLIVDASPRDIKRRIDDLKHAEEVGEAKEEHSHAFALDPPPKLEHIQEAASRLQDPEQRIIEEFFWFWPLEWGKGKQDPALVSLAKGNRNIAFKIWTNTVSSRQAAESIVSKHNLAVLHQLIALDAEQLALDQSLSTDFMNRIDRYWRACFKWWEELTADETFWSLVTERIRMLNDPRLTTGFARRMRGALPEALDKINGWLARQFAERGKLEFARKHLAYMTETHKGLDNVAKTLSIITKPLQTRIRAAIEKANSVAAKQPEQAAHEAYEMFKAVAGPIGILKSILPSDDHDRIDLCDAVAEAALACLGAFAHEKQDWNQCLKILNIAQRIAESQECRTRVKEQRSLVHSISLVRPILDACERTFSAAEQKPEGAVIGGNHLLSSIASLLAKLDENGVTADFRDRARDEVAATLMQCAVLFANKTAKWQPCIPLLEASLGVVASADLKLRIVKNLQTVRHNEKIFGNLKPISSAPSLRTVNGIGFVLYGAGDKDPESGSHVSTYYFVFFAIPVFPIRRYRVIPTEGGYRFLGRVPLRTFDRWHLFISLTLLALSFLGIVTESNSSSGGHNSYKPSRSSSSSSHSVAPSPRLSYESRASQSALASEIEEGKRRAKIMESQIDQQDRLIEDYEDRMNSYRALELVDEYNELVPLFNSLVRRRNEAYGKYKILISEINAKVERYNVGYR